MCFHISYRSELNEVKRRWNSHYIRKSHCTVNPGIPDELFFLPEQHSFQDCGVTVTNSDIQHIIHQRDVIGEAVDVLQNEDESLSEYFKYVVSSVGLNHPPSDWNHARYMFKVIIRICNV